MMDAFCLCCIFVFSIFPSASASIIDHLRVYDNTPSVLNLSRIDSNASEPNRDRFNTWTSDHLHPHHKELASLLPMVISESPYFIRSNCGPTQVFLVVVVVSKATHFAQRAAIRQSWAQVVPSDVAVRFLVGAADNATEHINDESKKFDDVIQLKLDDGYGSLSIKSLLMLRWVSESCENSLDQGFFLLKVDDDSYLDLPALISNLRLTPHKTFIMGRLISGAQPSHNRLSKYFTPRYIYGRNYYPQYVSGSAYIVSGDALKQLFLVCVRTRVFWLEDIYLTGICAKKASIPLIHNVRFNSFDDVGELVKPLDGIGSSNLPCRRHKWMVLHRVQPQQMLTLWEQRCL